MLPISSRALRGLAASAVLALPVVIAACGDGGGDPPTAVVTPPPAPPPTAQIAPAVRGYVDTALLFTEQVYYYGDTVDWRAKRTRTFARAGAAQLFRQAHPAIDTAIRELGDPHSFFYPPGQTLGNREDPSGPLYTPTATVIAPRIGYLWLTSFGGRNPAGRADTLQRLIARTDSATDACGWIIDQRANIGGFWPVMLVGIAPLVTEGRVGGFVERDPFWRYFYFLRDGAAGLVFPDERTRRLDSTVFLRQASSYRLRRPNPPVAILQGRFTASAGEIVVMAFKDSTRTVRTFGGPTSGVTTQPYTYRLADTASIQVTASIMFDRRGRDYAGRSIPPDETVSGPGVSGSFTSAFQPATRDPVVDAAIAWLQAQPGCRASADVPASADGVPMGRWLPTRGPAGVLPDGRWPRRGTPWTAAPTPAWTGWAALTLH